MNKVGMITLVKDGDKYYQTYSQDEKAMLLVLEEKELSDEQIEHIEKNIKSIYDMTYLKLSGYSIEIKQ